jgi:hypothetical protein
MQKEYRYILKMFLGGCYAVFFKLFMVFFVFCFFGCDDGTKNEIKEIPIPKVPLNYLIKY